MTKLCKRALALGLSTVLALSSAAPTTMTAVASYESTSNVDKLNAPTSQELVLSLSDLEASLAGDWGISPLAETGNAPDTPPNLSAGVGTDGYATLTWTAPANNDKN